jgi:hypothetical protein
VRQKEKEKKEKKEEKTEIIIKILGQCLSCPHLHLMTFFHWTHSHKFIYQLATVRKQKQSHFYDITRVFFLILAMKTSFSYSLHLSSSLQVYTVKRLAIFPSPAGMSLTKLSLTRKNLTIPVQGEFGK